MGVVGDLFNSVLFGLVPFAVLAGGARLYWSKVACRFFTVAEGQFYRSGAMPPGRLVRKVRQHGIRAVIDLRSARPAVEREKAALAEIGVKHFHVPSRQLPRPETVDAVLELLDRPENQPALIHCSHGVRRAAQFEAIYRIEFQCWRNERALSRLQRRSAFMSFRPGSRGTRFLRHYVPRRARPLAAAS
ncbi:MAG: fused DSP-PTPase phosphatase/NAD kinase-like protein [Myxococcota bacterium]